MKRDVEPMRELEPADLDEVSGGIAPLLLVGGGMALGIGAKYVWDNYLKSAPPSASRGAIARECWGQNRGANHFEVEVCRK
jgi:hypothetical protein